MAGRLAPSVRVVSGARRLLPLGQISITAHADLLLAALPAGGLGIGGGVGGAGFVNAGLQGVKADHAFAIQAQARQPAFFRLGAFKAVKHEISQAPDDGLATIQAGTLGDMRMAADERPGSERPGSGLAIKQIH